MDIHPTYSYPDGLDKRPPREVRQQAVRGAGPLRWLWRLLLTAVLLALLVAAAWVLSNLQDADPAPRPAALLLPAPKLSPERNAAYALMGLNAAADRDAAQLGRETQAVQTRLGQQWSDALSPADRSALMTAANAEIDALRGTSLPQPRDEPWRCDELENDCVSQVLAQADALVQQRQSVAVVGARCDALMGNTAPVSAFAFEEVLPTVWYPAVHLAGHIDNAALCGRWFRTAAVLALRQGRKEEAIRQLSRDNQLLRGLLAGSHTLIATQVSQSLLRLHMAVVSGMVLQDRTLAVSLLPLLAPWDSPEAVARRWVVAESAHAQGAVLGVARDPAEAPVEPFNDAQPQWLQPLQRAAYWAQRYHLGWHPQRTVQLMDAQALAMLTDIDQGLPQALAAARQADAAVGTADAWRHLLRWWRNPFGRFYAETAKAAYVPCMARALDLELHREAARLALNAMQQAVAPAERASWAQQQTLSAPLRERLAWSAGGDTLTVRTWSADLHGPAPQQSARDLITIVLERAKAG